MSDLGLDMAAAIDRMGDRDLYIEICHELALELPRLQKEITVAMDNGAWPDARRFSHSLKSNCAAVGAEQLRGSMYDVELACHNNETEKARQLFQDVKPQLDSLRETLLGLA